MEEIINSIMQSPENTNPNVLRDQLKGLATGGSEITVVHNVNGTLDITAGELFELCQNGVCFIEDNFEYQPILDASSDFRSETNKTYYNFSAYDWHFSAEGYDEYPQFS